MSRYFHLHAALLLLTCWPAMVQAQAVGDAPAPASPAAAQPMDAQPPVNAALSREVLLGRIAEIEKDTELDKAIKTRLLETLKLTLTQVDAAEAHRAAAAMYKQQIETAPRQTQEIRQALAKAPPVKPEAMELPAATTAADAGQMLVKAQAELAGATSRLADLEARLKTQQSRPAAVREAIVAAKKKLEDLDLQAAAPAPADEPPALTEARRQSLAALRLATQAEAQMLDQELLSFDARSMLLTAQRDQATRQLSQADAQVKLLQAAVNERRRMEAEQARLEAERIQREAIGKHPMVIELADGNAELSRELTDITAHAGQATSQRQVAADELKRIDQDYQDAKRKIDVAGLTETLGRILRDQRNRLPDLMRYQRTAAVRTRLISEVGLAQIQVDEKRRSLADIDQVVEQRMEALFDPAMPPWQRREIEQELRKLLLTRQELLNKLTSSYGGYMKSLGDLEFAQRQLLAKSDEYARFLDERLLWIPSAPMADMATARQINDDVKWVFNPASWSATWKTLLAESGERPVLAFVALLAFLSLMLGRRKLYKWEMENHERIGKPMRDNFWITLRVLLITLLLAATWPLLFLFAGALLNHSYTASIFSRAVGSGLVMAAWVAFILLAIKAICAPKDWPNPTSNGRRWRPGCCAAICAGSFPRCFRSSSWSP